MQISEKFCFFFENSLLKTIKSNDNLIVLVDSFSKRNFQRKLLAEVAPPRKLIGARRDKRYTVKRKWRNWQTRTAQDRMGKTLRVQLPSSAPIL